MNVSSAFVYWVIAIFIWIYLLPILFIGTLFCIPFFLVVTPPLLIISFTFMYFLKDEIIPEGYIRNCVNNIPYHLWFGTIDRIPTLSTPHLICSHPHGILCTGILISTHFRPNSTTVFAVSKWLFTVPFVGWLARHLGCIPATYDNIEKALLTQSVILVPGGVPELVTGVSYTHRYGFLKIAHKMNVHILPVVTNTTFFDIIPCPFKEFRKYIAIHIGLPLMFPVIGWNYTWIPKPLPIRLNIGKIFTPTGNVTEDNGLYYSSLTLMSTSSQKKK